MSFNPRILLPVLVAVVALGGAVLLYQTVMGGNDRILRAGFDSAIQMTPGQEVRMAGRKVGEIRKVDVVDGRAAVDLEIEDGDVWPLPRGTIARSRTGSTSAYLGRYTELIPGPDGAGSLPNDGILRADVNETAFELDEAYRIFRGRTKEDAGRTVDGLGAAVDGKGPALRRGLRAAPKGLDTAASVMTELTSDTERLRTLAVAGDRTATALAEKSGELGQLVVGAASTFDELASKTRAQQAALERAPGAFGEGTRTLARLDSSIVGLDALVSDLEPGAPALRKLSRSARLALGELRRTAPLATSTLKVGTTAAPPVKRLLTTATPVMPKLRKTLAGATPVFECVRPYTPEVIGYLSTWTGMLKNFDSTSHYARTFPLTVMPALLPGTKNSPAAAMRLQPRLKYAFPRPPGLAAGKPQFNADCGITRDALDPSKDPEGAG